MTMRYLKEATIRAEDASEELSKNVASIIKEVRKNGDKALLNYNQKFDNCSRKYFAVSTDEIREAYEETDSQVIDDIKAAIENVRKFSIKQRESLGEVKDYEVVPGVFLGHRNIPLDSCGCYVPGGGYPLYSTAIMLVVPAKVAGVKRVVACSPPVRGTNKIHPYTLVAMNLAGADEIYVVGGVQAIGALSYGTDQIKKVNKIVGPGNQYVTEAKRQCFGPVGIDFVAGPSEVLIIADEIGNPAYIAADILAQCEHDLQARGILLTTDEGLGNKVIEEVEKQLEELDTKEFAAKSWEDNGEIILFDSLEEAYEYSNEYAPEHLEIHLKDEEAAIENLLNYGSLFIGENAAEVLGDYISGTNHTLPTLGAAKYTGGVSVLTFLKTVTNQRITKEGIDNIGSIAARMARGENLEAHARAAEIRL